MLRITARAYAILVAASMLWMWALEIALRDSPQEHLLPFFVLTVLSFPTTIGVNYALDTLPISTTFTQYMAITSIAAIVQALAVYKLASLVETWLDRKAR